MPAGGSGLLFKGSGFYITDYRSSGYKEKASQDKGGGASGGEKSGGDRSGGAAKGAPSKAEAPAAPKNEEDLGKFALIAFGLGLA